MFTPHFRITSAITKALMSIEADRQAITMLPIDVEMLASLRETARLILCPAITGFNSTLVLLEGEGKPVDARQRPNCFNSSLVLLEAAAPTGGQTVVSKFQFQLGSIRRCLDASVCLTTDWFQFHLGSIRGVRCPTT